jgi:hypothetical protein
MARLPSDEDFAAMDAALDPYFMALGKTAHAWNHLQEELGQLFCFLTNTDAVGLTIWHALKSDRSQRDLIEAALRSLAEGEDWVKEFPRAQADISWLLLETNKLADRRNDAIHAPCTVSNAHGDFEMIPLSFHGNPRARKLRGKQIVNEFQWYGETANVLKSFARHLCVGLNRSPYISWPDRPRMPTLRQDPIHKEPHRKGAAK